MLYKSILGAVCACLSVVSFNVNASVFNTLNGVNYEWLELTQTQGMSRNQVQVILDSANPGDLFYGYEYASRALMEDLLASYMPWDGINGWHSNELVVSGSVLFVADFGDTFHNINGSTSYYTTVEGDRVAYDENFISRGYYGLAGECRDATYTCSNHVEYYNDSDGLATMAHQSENYGYNQNFALPAAFKLDFEDPTRASFLVRSAVVPIPAAVWLFGSGLIGLIGLARRKA